MPDPQTTTNMLSLIPKMGKRPARLREAPLVPSGVWEQAYLLSRIRDKFIILLFFLGEKTGG
jgi:hypothetical protein